MRPLGAQGRSTLHCTRPQTHKETPVGFLRRRGIEFLHGCAHGYGWNKSGQFGGAACPYAVPRDN